MTKEHAAARTRTSRLFGRPEELYEPLLDLIAFDRLAPPAEMTGEIHKSDARVGGGYRMALFYPSDERASS
jgi:hypothetical protein